jgi:hypothetical protein
MYNVVETVGGPVGTVIVISYVLVLVFLLLVIFRVLLFTLPMKFDLFFSSNIQFTRLLAFILIWGAEVSTPVQQYVLDVI